ncbi:MAG TPA: hypothetical protein VNQ90_05220 [Chthoniobacteraceae bacterium]|nr:hypothetical protein [Chthoniobacteraceae bacterium]
MAFFQKPVRVLLLFPGAVVLLAAILVSAARYDAHRNRRAWEKHRAAAVARGVEYDFTRFAPAPVPDGENFAATPFFRELFAADEATQKKITKRLKLHPADEAATLPSDRLKAVRPHDALLDEISRAAERPAAVFPLRYDRLGAVSLPHALPLMRLAKLYRLRGKAFLEAGLPDKAFADLQTLFRLTRHSGNRDPILIMRLVQATLFSFTMDVYREGLGSRQWSDRDLLQIQAELQSFDFLSTGQQAYQAERAAYISQVELLIHAPPEAKIKAPDFYKIYHDVSGDLPVGEWLYSSLFQADRFFEASLQTLLNPAAGRVDAEQAERIRQAWESFSRKPEASRLFILLGFRSLLGTTARFAHSQTLADLGTVAAALERYHRQHDGYPATLSALIPSHLEKLPHDLVTGGPLHYCRTDDGRFLLYSVGWNGTDEGGTSAKDKTEGDWVWPLLNE